MEKDLDFEADNLVKKIKHYLITSLGRLVDEADDEEFYRAFSYALREEVMANWKAAAHTHVHNDVRMLYYLSMEYLPGRILSNTITNLSEQEVVRLVMHKMNRSLRTIIQHEPDPGLGHGGLGRLASCFMDSLATHQYPAQAYGLRYHYGIFEQQLWNGEQIEAPDCWLIMENPWEFRRDLRRVTVDYNGEISSSTNIHGDEIYQLHDPEEVWALPYDTPIVGYSDNSTFTVLTLRLWTTKESPRNFHLQRFNAGRLDQAAENTTLTNVLYPSDHHQTGKRIRLKQEFLLVSASLQDIIRHYCVTHDNFRLFADKVRIQINDTHPALVVAELMRLLITDYEIPWKKALEITQECTAFTNHTVLKESLEEWEVELIAKLLPAQYKIIERLNLDFCNMLRRRYPNDEEKVRRLSIIESGKVRMANLAIAGSHTVNGVAKLHTEILKNKIFSDFYELYPEKFVNVTNGVTQRRWLQHCNPALARFITKRIGHGWITDFEQIKNLAQYASDAEAHEEFWEIKKKNKENLADFIKRENILCDSSGQRVITMPPINADSLFDVHIKRIHEYKRQLMNVLHVIMLYQEIKGNSAHGRVPRTVIFGGKAAAQYETAKAIISLIYAVARKINADRQIKGALKVIFIENYNVSRAEILIPAADLSEQISTAGMEASGTGNMKLAMNGALTIGTDDGANIEMRQHVTDPWWPFLFGLSAEEVEHTQKGGAYNPSHIMDQHPQIRATLNALVDRTFAESDPEHFAFCNLFHKLTESHYGGPPDRYFTIKDLVSYAATQKKVDELFKSPALWAEYAIHNIAAMGYFSTDRSIRDYSEKIWGLRPCPIDMNILDRVRSEYSLAKT